MVQDYVDRLAACGRSAEATAVWKADVSLDVALQGCVESIRGVQRLGGVVHLIGNGGSAAVVAHAQNDLVKAAGIRAQVHQDVPLLTACANDDGYDRSLARPLSVWLRPGDVVIAVSSSGQSANLLAAVAEARRVGATVITFSGFLPTNPLRARGDINVYVPSHRYGFVELSHATLLHYLTDRLAHA